VLARQLLGDRHQPHAALCEPADVELELELIAEEAAEAVHDAGGLDRWRTVKAAAGGAGRAQREP
jgi:hypothetical protein